MSDPQKPGDTLRPDKPVGEMDPLPHPTRKQNLVALGIVLTLLAFMVIGGPILYVHSHRGGAQTPGGMMAGRASSPGGMHGGTGAGWPTVKINDLNAQFAGTLRQGNSEIQIEFKDTKGQLVDVGSVKFGLQMNMPGMPMHSEAVVSGGGGRYKARVQPEMSGDWYATVSYSGPKGSGEKSFKVSVR